MSTQHLGLMVPSESTTVYFLGAVQNTVKKKYSLFSCEMWGDNKYTIMALYWGRHPETGCLYQ